MKNLLRGALTAAVAMACGGGDSTANAGIVQLVSVTTNVLTVSCGRLNQLANPDTLYMSTHLVNTTAADVAIDSIGSVGTVVRATNQAIVGQGALNYTRIPYHPFPALLQARTGDLTIIASVPTSALCAGTQAALDYKDVSLSVRVTTAVGQFVSSPVTIRMTVN